MSKALALAAVFLMVILASALGTEKSPAAEGSAVEEASALPPSPLEGIEWKSHCQVTYTACPCGRISCSGHMGCKSGPGWVECDGNRIYCKEPAPCQISCPSDPETSCTGQCECKEVEGGISCDGSGLFC